MTIQQFQEPLALIQASSVNTILDASIQNTFSHACSYYMQVTHTCYGNRTEKNYVVHLPAQSAAHSPTACHT